MPKIQLNYLYRDGSNYKHWGEAILPNPDSLSLEDFEAALRAELIYETWFYHRDWHVPDLHPAAALMMTTPPGTSSAALSKPAVNSPAKSFNQANHGPK